MFANFQPEKLGQVTPEASSSSPPRPSGRTPWPRRRAWPRSATTSISTQGKRLSVSVVFRLKSTLWTKFGNSGIFQLRVAVLVFVKMPWFVQARHLTEAYQVWWVACCQSGLPSRIKWYLLTFYLWRHLLLWRWWRHWRKLFFSPKDAQEETEEDEEEDQDQDEEEEEDVEDEEWVEVSCRVCITSF